MCDFISTRFRCRCLCESETFCLPADYEVLNKTEEAKKERGETGKQRKIVNIVSDIIRVLEYQSFCGTAAKHKIIKMHKNNIYW